MKRKRGKKRIRRLGRAEMCNVKHHRCQLGNLGPGLAPIHKSRRLERRASPMWIESEVATGPPDAGGGWPGWVAASKAKQPAWAQREQCGAREPGLGWAEGEKTGSEERGRLRSDLFGVPGDLRAHLVEFNELSVRWPFVFDLVILLGEEGGLGPAFVKGGRVFS